MYEGGNLYRFRAFHSTLKSLNTEGRKAHLSFWHSRTQCMQRGYATHTDYSEKERYTKPSIHSDIHAQGSCSLREWCCSCRSIRRNTRWRCSSSHRRSSGRLRPRTAGSTTRRHLQYPMRRHRPNHNIQCAKKSTTIYSAPQSQPQESSTR